MRHSTIPTAAGPITTGAMSRRLLLAVTGSAMAARQPGNATVRADDLASITPPPSPARRRAPAFPAEMTELRAQAEWAQFKHRFIQPDGRIVDNGNGGISHSEGQAFGLLFAAHFDERDTFARLLRWTRGALSRPEDHLLAWCHRPQEGARPGDRNNATDGDLIAAWALAEAADRWGDGLHRGLAIAMARDILDKLVVETGAGAMLLPGIQGFRHADGLTLNPSYSVYPAFHALSRLLPSGRWAALEEGGLQLARVARFGRWGLVPDWVTLSRSSARPGLAPDRPPRFSYDAVRVPLYMAWAGHGMEVAVASAARFWHDPAFARMPAWADLRTDQRSHYAADPGIEAVAQLSAISSQPGFMPRHIGTPVTTSTYYAAALRLMTVLALRTMPAPSMPPVSLVAG